MKPRILCAECAKEIQVGEEKCPHCGTVIDWTSAPDEVGGVEAHVEVRTCGKCGSENTGDAQYCGTCGAKLQGGGSQTPPRRQSSKAEKGKGSKKKEAEPNPLFSWKVIFAFMGILLILVVAVELFSKRDEQQPTQGDNTAAPMPASSIQLAGQISELEKQLASSPDDMQLVLKLANVSHDGRFFEKAIMYYKKYLDKNLKDANARVDLGICYFEKGDNGEAEQQMLTALKYDPKHLQAHFNLGIVCLKQRKMQEASDWFKKTIDLAPPNSDIAQQAKQFLEQHSSPLIQNK